MAFEYLADYVTFDSVSDMDIAVEQHIQQQYFNLTDSERAIVFALASRSLMYPGASHLKASTIAEALEISTKTVYRFMVKLVELGIIEKIAGTKLNGIKGASIYRILPNVPSSVSQRMTTDDASDTKVCEQVSENQSFNSFNLLESFKTSTIQDIYNNAHATKEASKKYMNEYQKMLFDFMHSLPLRDELKDELYKVVLASKVDNMKDFVAAKNVMFKIAVDIADGILTVASTLRAVFVGAYSNAIERRESRQSINLSSIEETTNRKRPAPFYNWLNERDSYTQVINNRPSIDNWLLW